MNVTDYTEKRKVGRPQGEKSALIAEMALDAFVPSVLEPITVTVKDACRVSGLGPTTVWRLISEEKLQTVKIGGRTLVTVASLKALLSPAAAE